ncbi:MAG: hypothetical protein Q3M30_16260 [Candidatus Electrothrix sp. Rat3]|nr:hypothetical protein [Candidatus Electrothrix rattekaaiensis]
MLVFANVRDGIHRHRVAGQAAEIEVKGGDHQAPAGYGQEQERHHHLIEQTEANDCTDKGGGWGEVLVWRIHCLCLAGWLVAVLIRSV